MAVDRAPLEYPTLRGASSAHPVQNIEIKSPLADRSAVESNLRLLDAELVWTRRQRDTFFRVRTGWLKLRQVTSDATDARAELIAYSRPTDHSGARPSDYLRAPVADGAGMRALLARGLEVEAEVCKERTLWRWRHTRVHLDRVDGLGDFLELETVVDGILVEEAEQELEEVIEALRLDRSRFLARPYKDMLE